MGIMEADFLGPRATFTGLAGDSLGADAAVEEPDGDTLDATLMDRDHFQGPCEYQATCFWTHTRTGLRAIWFVAIPCT